MSDEVIVCRCEDVTLREIHNLIVAGTVDLEEIKQACRCGMGPCQGRNCLPLVAQEVARLTRKPASEVALPTFRPPASPIKLGALGKGADHG